MSGLAGRCVAVVAAGVCLLPLLAAADGGVTRAVNLQGNYADAAAHPYCAELDAEAFAEAAPGLRGLHLMQDGAEIGFLTTVSEPASTQTDAARILHLREESGALLFDLAMPARAYTELAFHLRLKDFAATAEISANDVPGTTAGKRLGEFKLFDLEHDHLARQMTVQIPESQARILHVVLHAAGKNLQADDLAGVDVAPDRDGQSLYTAVATTAQLAETKRETIAELDVPAHVPVQRIRFETGTANFLRRVRVEAWPASDANDVETISGEISSTHRTQAGITLADTQLVVPMTLGANLQGPSHVRVIVENNGEAPLQLKRVTLEMRQHKLCFDAKSVSAVTLVEGGDGVAQGSAPALAQESWERAGVAVLGTAVAQPEPVEEAHKDIDAHASAGTYFIELHLRRITLAGIVVFLLCAGVLLSARGRRKSRTR